MEAPWLQRVGRQLDDRPLCAWCLAQGRITVAVAVAYAGQELDLSAGIASTIRQTRRPSWGMPLTSGLMAIRSTVATHGTGRAPQGVRRYKLPASPIANSGRPPSRRRTRGRARRYRHHDRGADGDSDAAKAGRSRGQLDVRLRAKTHARGIPESQSCTKSPDRG